MRKSETVPIYEKKLIDATELGTHSLGSTPPETYTIPVSVTIFCDQMVDPISNELMVSIGTNSPDFDNILDETDLSDIVNDRLKFFSQDIDSGVSVSGEITLKISGVINSEYASLIGIVKTKQITV